MFIPQEERKVVFPVPVRPWIYMALSQSIMPNNCVGRNLETMTASDIPNELCRTFVELRCIGDRVVADVSVLDADGIRVNGFSMERHIGFAHHLSYGAVPIHEVVGACRVSSGWHGVLPLSHDIFYA